MFDAIPISIRFESEIEAVAKAGIVKRFVAVSENDRVVDVVLLAQFMEERVSEDCGSDGPQLWMNQFVGFWIDGGVRSVFLPIEPDHGFIDRDVIWRATRFRL